MCASPLCVWAAQVDGDAGVVVSRHRRPATPGRLRANPHQLLEPLDLGGFHLDPPLAPGAALEVVDGYRATAKHERTGIRLGEPIVEARPGNAQAAGRYGEISRLSETSKRLIGSPRLSSI